jgi:TPR repeat protein
MNSESSFDDLLARAKEGDADAQFQLGEYYDSHGGVTVEEIAEWYMKAANQNHAQAQLALGLLYLEWLYDEDYREQAQYWLERAAESGCEDAVKVLVELGGKDEYIDNSDLLVEAEEGNPEAQFELGSMMYFGIGLRQRPSEGLSLIQKAAVAGHPRAQVLLGYEYLFGTNVDRNEGEAIKWLWLSAQQDSAEAYYYLGACYSEAWGVARNEEQAAACLLKAAQMGNANAQYHLSQFYHEGIGLSENQEQAEAWCRAAALQGNEWAKETLKYL